MWLTFGLTFGVLITLAFASRRWRDSSRRKVGWMSQQWLAQHQPAGR
jgi:hypothetical protein